MKTLKAYFKPIDKAESCKEELKAATASRQKLGLPDAQPEAREENRPPASLPPTAAPAPAQAVQKAQRSQPSKPLTSVNGEGSARSAGYARPRVFSASVGLSRDALLQEMLHGAHRKAAEPGLAGTAARLRAMDDASSAPGASRRPATTAGAGTSMESPDATADFLSNPATGSHELRPSEAQEAALEGQRERPAKRPCLDLQRSTGPPPPTASSARMPSPATASLAPALAADGFPLPKEQRRSLPCLIEARSLGRLRPAAQQALWLERRPGLTQATAWDAALRQRLPSVLHQDAITQIEMSTTCGSGSGAGSGSGGIRLAIAQANQCVRIVPYGVLRDAALEARSRRRAAGEGADGGRSDQERSDDDDDGGASRRRRHTSPSVQRLQLQPWDELAHRGTRVLARSSSSTHAPSSAHATAHASSSSAAAAAAAAAASSGLPASSVLTLSLRQHVSALGWDPRRPGRLALVDRASPHVLLLDLGASRQDMVRSHLSAAAPTAAVTSLGAAAAPAGGGGAAARNLVYLRYPRSHDAPYTLAAAGRASGPDGAVVHLWDERAGRGPAARLPCPGSAALVAPLEAPAGEAHCLMGVVHPSTLVVWDVRGASCGLSSGIKGIGQGGGGASMTSGIGGGGSNGGIMSLGGCRPAPNGGAAGAATAAVVGSWELRGPLAALGCWQPVVAGLAADPRDSSRLALLMMDGSSALWNLAAGAPSHAYPAPSPLTAAYAAAAAAAAATAEAAAAVAAAGGAAAGSGVTTASLAALLCSRPAAMGDAVAATAAAGGPLGGLKGVCGLVGAMQGAWDADVCGFWHPAALLRQSASVAAGASGGEGGAAAAPTMTRPGLVLSDFRPASRNAELAVEAAVEAMATARASATSTLAGGGAAASAAGVPSAPSASYLAAAALAAAQLRRRAAAVTVPLESWPLSVACVGETGDVICGTLGGELLHWAKC